MSINTKYEVERFDDEDAVVLSQAQREKLAVVLLESGKFVELDGEIVNISTIKKLKKVRKVSDDYEVGVVRTTLGREVDSNRIIKDGY